MTLFVCFEFYAQFFPCDSCNFKCRLSLRELEEVASKATLLLTISASPRPVA